MKIIKYDGQSANRLFGEREELTSGVESLVKNIIEEVKLNGDVALKKYAAQFDGYTGGQLKVTPAEFDEAFASLSKSYIATLERSVENISRFHKRQLTEGFEINDGDRVVGQKVIPVARAGIYVPGFLSVDRAYERHTRKDSGRARNNNGNACKGGRKNQGGGSCGGTALRGYGGI